MSDEPKQNWPIASYQRTVNPVSGGNVQRIANDLENRIQKEAETREQRGTGAMIIAADRRIILEKAAIT